MQTFSAAILGMGFIYWDGVVVLTVYKAGFLIYIICIPSKKKETCWNVAMNPTYFTKSKAKHAKNDCKIL